MRNTHLVTIEDDGDTKVHLPSGVGAGYATLCGLDEDDPMLGIRVVATKPDARVTCPACIAIWRLARSIPPRLIAT